MPLCCFNCKIQKPQFGDNCCEKFASIISIILFLLFIVEIAAYTQFINAFEAAEGVSCCGAIDQSSDGESYDIAGSVCSEDDFAEERPYIPRIEINASYFCTVDNRVCDRWNITISNYTAFYDKALPNRTSMETSFDECLNVGNFTSEDMCNEEVLEQATQDSISGAINACWIAISFGVLTSSICLCEFVGCFRDSAFCENKCSSLCTKSCEVYFWLMVVILSITWVENPAGNGYRVDNLIYHQDELAAEAWDYLRANCNPNEVDFEDVQATDYPAVDMIWTELEIDVPEWLASDAYNYVGYFGIAASLIEFMIYFHQQCCAKKKKEDITAEQTVTQIEMNQTK